MQRRVAARLRVTEVHLSHVLVERITADDAELASIAEAIEQEAAENVDDRPVDAA